MTTQNEEKIRVLTQVKSSLHTVKAKSLLAGRLEKALNTVQIIFNENSPQVLKLRALIEAVDYSKLEDFISMSNTGKVTHLYIDGWESYRVPIINALDIIILELRLDKSTTTKTKTAANIFISYRRVDSSAHAALLSTTLEMRLGSNPIFFDVNSIKPGTNFRKAIETAVKSCQVLLAVIGKQWLTIADDNGNRRLDDPSDFVRLEIATALNQDILVIPVLVDGANMPKQDDLPNDLKPLADIQAISLTHDTFRADVDRLIANLP